MAGGRRFGVQSLAVISERRNEDFSERLKNLDNWYHSFSLPDGTAIEGCISLETLQERWREFNLPENLAGKRVLDIGAWDGWFSFEAARRGADVTAVDNWENPKFIWLQKQYGLSVNYLISDLFRLPDRRLQPFDYVFFLGVLYHVRHPLLGLEIVASLTRDTAFIDSFVIDSQERGTGLPYLEFYETDELGNQLDNWFGPTVSCLHSLCRAAGFVRVEMLSIRHSHATVKAHRQWEPVDLSSLKEGRPCLKSAVRVSDQGINFDSNSDQHLACYFTAEHTPANRHEVYFSIGPFAAEVLKLTRYDDYYLASLRLPPGLSAGWWEVRLRIRDSQWSNPSKIVVDMPVRTEPLTIGGCRDAVTANNGQVARSSGAVSLWLTGLAENADAGNIRIRLGEHRLLVKFVASGGRGDNRQVNALLPGSISAGSYTLEVEHGGAVATTNGIQVT